jgi:diacylglycerol O-acyltransferase
MKRLSGLDAAFLSAETKNWPSHVACITIFDPAKAGREFDLDVLKRSLASRLDRLPPLRWRVIEAPLGLGHPHWIDDPEFDLDWHIRRMGIAAPGGKRELAAAAQDIYRHRLDRRRPLWELWVLDQLADGKVGLFWKIHHACIDGMAGAGMQEVMFDATADYQPPDVITSDGWEPEEIPDPTRLLISSLPAAVGAQIRAGREILRMAGRIGELARSVGSAMPHDVPRTRFNQPLGQRRAWGFVSLSLNDLKTVKNAFGVKLNDVFVATVSGAVRAYLDARNELPEDSLVASIPVNARADDSPSTGNVISGMTASMATHLADPVDRLQAIHLSTMASKEMQKAMGAQALMSLADTPPPAMFTLAARFYGKTQLVKRLPTMFNMVISNVPGPREPLYSQGAPVEAFHSMGIIYDGPGLFVGAMSYLDQMDVGILGDPDALDDPFEFADGMAEELSILVGLARERLATEAQPEPGKASRVAATARSKQSGSAKENRAASTAKGPLSKGKSS